MGEVHFLEEQEARIAGWLKTVKFRKQIFGGVSQADVFRKIGELNDMYREALIAERARCDALMAEKPSETAKGKSASKGTKGMKGAKEGDSS